MTDSEKHLLKLTLAVGRGEKTNLLLETLEVQEMLNSGSGALYILSGRDKVLRSFGEQIGEYEFKDSDGVPVSVTLNVDDRGDLYELDIWKVDFTPVKKFPT